MEIMDPIRSWGEPLVDEWAERLGAKCKALGHGSHFESRADHRVGQMSDRLECGTTIMLLTVVL